MIRLTIKMALIGALSTMLLIPTAYICSLTKERKDRRDEVARSTGNLWGSHHEIGTILEAGKESILPQSVDVTGSVLAETRNRGIYSLPFYSADITMQVQFFLERESQASVIRLYGVKASEADFLTSKLDDLEIRFKGDDEPRQVAAHAGTLSRGTHKLTIHFKMNGTQRLHFVPAANTLTVDLKSNWPHPNFSGSILPAERTIDANGFHAKWIVKPQNASAFLAELKNNEYRETLTEGEEATSFGVDFFVPVDIYAQIERASKYAMLFISLTFLTFFVFEAVAGLQIHPVQYLFVGLALSLFFLLLLSLAEHIGFARAYGLASVADLGLITAYSLKILKSRTRAGILLGVLAGLYSFLYVVLQLEMYSLLAGSIGLFLILAIVMYATRNIDWYAKEPART